MYAEDLAEAVWRPATGHASEGELRHADRSTLNPLDHRLLQAPHNAGSMWQIFSTYVMAKPLQGIFSRGRASSAGGVSCPACAELARIVLEKYEEFEFSVRNESSSAGSEGGGTGESQGKREVRPDEVNNAFFAWQLTHESEQDEKGQGIWPELYRDSEDFVELKNIAKLACLEYLQQVYDAPLSALDLAQLELSIWASVTRASSEVPAEPPGSMGLAFHDHPLALLSGVFYAQAGGRNVAERTPTVFADPRGTTAFRYTNSRRQQPPAPAEEDAPGSPRPRQGRPGTGRAGAAGPSARGSRARRRGSRRGASRDSLTEDTLEPTAPFHRLAYAHAYEGLALVFPSWLVHGVPPHGGNETRVTFAFNLHTLQGTTLSSWAKTTL